MLFNGSYGSVMSERVWTHLLLGYALSVITIYIFKHAVAV